jgi:4,5-DOPA dioxygenase extradiol
LETIMSDPRMPVLFVGHGSPMNAIEDNAITRGWQAVARRLPRPRAIVCVSAHWETRGVGVNSAAQPSTIHDFGGFPQALFDVRYAAPGDPALAQRIARLSEAPPIHADPGHGLDHGAWSVLRVMYPDADIPVLQLSLDTSQPGAFHYALGRKLAPLREEGVLIVGSGNIVHNLRLLSWRDMTPPDWALRADAVLRQRIVDGDHEALVDWHTLGADVALGIPSPEHYLPLLYALALQRPDDALQLFNQTVLGTLSMTSLCIAPRDG